MDVLNSLGHGFVLILSPYNLLMAMVGCFLGTIVGILPGLGGSSTIALLLPFVFGMDPIPALIMLHVDLLTEQSTEARQHRFSSMSPARPPPSSRVD